MPHQRKCEFLELEPRHICGQCNDVLLDPVQLLCGHLICARCVPGMFGDETEVICKIGKCGKRINKNEIFPDRRTSREIQNLKVYCTNKEHGCEELIPWEMLQDHLTTKCEYVQKNTTCKTGHSNLQDNQNQRGDHGICRNLFKEDKIWDAVVCVHDRYGKFSNEIERKMSSSQISSFDVFMIYPSQRNLPWRRKQCRKNAIHLYSQRSYTESQAWHFTVDWHEVARYRFSKKNIC